MWALGITLYQLLYYSNPWPDSSWPDYKKAVINSELSLQNDSSFDRLI